MRLLRWRQMFQLVVLAGVLWLVVLLYTHSTVRLSMYSVWNSLLRQNLDAVRLTELMAPPGDELSRSIVNPLELLVLPSEGMLSFYFLPKRQPLSLYTELTSANRDTSYPVAPDFTFHLEYHANDVLLYEDHGPGCVYRIFLVPPMPQDATHMHQLTSVDLRNAYLSIVIDGRTFWFSMQQVMEGREWPFVTPVNTRHPRPASGVGTYTPFCYQNSIKISYQHSAPLPPRLFEDMINCSRNDLTCSTHIYSAISRHKFPHRTTVPSFATQDLGKHKKMTENAAHMLSKPEMHGPESGSWCTLDCVEMCAHCRHNLLRVHSPGVIVAIKMRVFETATSRPLPNWNQLFFTAHFDGALTPQVDKVPLGSLFGATGSMNKHRGASMGRRKRTCSYSDGLLDLPATSMTSYLYFPMPFWRNALVTVEGSSSVDTSLLLCYKVTLVENYYKEEDTGYFHTTKSMFADNVDGHRTLLQLDNAWGHIVGVQMEVDNLRAHRAVALNLRWAALQADMLLYIDDATAATMMGTGLEDYFSYAHGFALAENTTYSFVGVYHASPRRSQPLSWHCYRLHLLDPIPFRRAVHFVVEGTRPNFFKEEIQLDWDDYSALLSEGGATTSYLVMYYTRNEAGATLTDMLSFGDLNSEEKHLFKMAPLSSRMLVPPIATLGERRYLGNALSNQTYKKRYRQFEAGDVFTFNMSISLPNKGVILRREFYAKPMVWNARADVLVDKQSAGSWFVPFGTLVEEYSLMQDDFLIGAELTNESSKLAIKVVTRTAWYDISYQVLVVH